MPWVSRASLHACPAAATTEQPRRRRLAWRLLPAQAVATATAGACIARLQGALAQQAGSVEQTVNYIWPSILWNMPLFGPSDPGGDDVEAKEAELCARLSDLGEKGYRKYTTMVLPKELQVDSAFAEEFRAADASKTNIGFLRWQKRVFAELSRVRVDELDWDGKPVPSLPGIPYKWKALHKSPEIGALVARLRTIGSAYLTSLRGDSENHQFRTFPWVEVYDPGDAQTTHVHTGAAIAGMFFARYAEGSHGSQKLVFEDTRGMIAPFGRTHEHQPVQGEVVLWPAWLPHYVSPNPGNSTNVFFSFLMWPPGGAPDFDWEDDVTGDWVYTKKSQIKVKAKGSSQPKGSGGHSEL